LCHQLRRKDILRRAKRPPILARAVMTEPVGFLSVSSATPKNSKISVPLVLYISDVENKIESPL
jgi:hypothetical protein